ncbi:MAG: hypothetical protein IJ991_15160, partial [Thermoguttaceae bacterium]|nr:hypothetical protein [Thermoguttaceae bacterium]
MEPLENRELPAVDAFGISASLADSDVGATWGPDPEPAAFSASELSTDAAETTISLAALNAVPYGPYVNSEQAAFIALRSNATLADETLADFTALWDETDVETTLADTTTDAETLNDVAESLTFEALDLGEIEQEPFPGDASVMSGSTGNSGGGGNSGGVAELIFDVSGGIDGSYVMPGSNLGIDAAILEGQPIIFTLTPESGNPDGVVVTATLSGLTSGFDYIGTATREITLNALPIWTIDVKMNVFVGILSIQIE